MIIRRYFILSLSALMLAGCAGNDISDTPDEERLPLRFETTLSNQLPVTRAVDDKIDASDELLCYVRHVINSETSVYTQVQGNLVTIKDNKPTTALYWDDFSNSNSAETDLRTANHGLQSYYGYCYNGATVAKDALKDVSGELTWSASTNQSADGIKTSDLLWSSVQALVPYDHAKIESIKVPYTHAMSKFTVIVVAGDGFTATDLDKAAVTLHDMQTKGTFTAPSAEVSATKTDNVTMYGYEKTENQRAFEAVVVPTTSLAKDKHLATITMAGNTYKVNISEAILTLWDKGIDNAASKSGINYQLTVTLNKQKVSVLATLADWTNVYANGKGEIQFTADVVDCGVTGDKFNDDDAFSLWRTTEANNFGDKATTCTYNKGVFKNNPEIYWPDANSSFYFRALAIKNGNTLVAKDDYAVKQGNDLLWGTSGDAAIAPRTGDVPLTFSHAMSNVVVKLETSNDDKSKVEIDKATIRITDLITDGTIAISSGDISLGTTVGEVAVDGETIMVPQTISTDAKLIITLADKKTTYSLKLSTIDNITKWVRGNQYTYTIHLEKEAMKFRAVIEEWKPTSGSGDAKLDWEDEDENS